MSARQQHDPERQLGESALEISAGSPLATVEQPSRASVTGPTIGSTTVGSTSSSAGEADSAGAMHQVTGATSADRNAYNEKQVAHDAEHREPPACIKTCQQTLTRWNANLEAFNQRAKEKRQGRKLAGTRYEVQQPDGKGDEEKKEGASLVQQYMIVPLVAFIYIWVYLVYVWRICTPMIRQEPRALNTRGAGIVMLILFNILWLLTIWTYVRVLVAKPGFVKDLVPESEAPELPLQQQQHQGMAQGQVLMQQGGQHVQPFAQPDAQSIPIEQSSLANGNEHAKGQLSPQHRIEEEEDINVNPSLAAAVGPMAAAALSGAKEQAAQQQQPQVLMASPPNESSAVPAPPPALLPEPVRMPPEVPPLHPSQRYCRKCKRIKPQRAHHCRKCGQCVLKMDHHCPWVGGCVGARNHKFFHNFLLWTTVLEVYMLITVAFHFARGMRRGRAAWPLDGYIVSLLPILGWFTLFTGLLLALHTYLFARNMTTIEQFANQRREARERVMLTMYFSPQGQGHALKRDLGPFGEQKERKAIKGRWEKAWGGLATRGSLWWLGGPGERLLAQKRAEKGKEEVLSGEMEEATKMGVNGKGAWLTNWKEVMGHGVAGWFLPIGKTPGDAMHYPLNPRFGLDGSWRPRDAWPEDLR